MNASRSNLNPLDHILWATPDLDQGCAEFSAASGVIPAGGGSHAGFGTRNRLTSLGEGLYFEVISVDPAQDNYRQRAERIGELQAATSCAGTETGLSISSDGRMTCSTSAGKTSGPARSKS